MQMRSIVPGVRYGAARLNRPVAVLSACGIAHACARVPYVTRKRPHGVPHPPARMPCGRLCRRAGASGALAWPFRRGQHARAGAHA